MIGYWIENEGKKDELLQKEKEKKEIKKDEGQPTPVHHKEKGKPKRKTPDSIDSK